jgi:hypothetical protein
MARDINPPADDRPALKPSVRGDGPAAEDRREMPRFTVDPMYSSVTVRPAAGHGRKGFARRPLDGHVYEVSMGGLRFELDRPLRRNAAVEIDLTLPGCEQEIHAHGRIVRVFDELDDPGPRRMAVEFESFGEGAKAILERYLAQKWLRRAVDQRPAPKTAPLIMTESTSPVKTRSASAA